MGPIWPDWTNWVGPKNTIHFRPIMRNQAQHKTRAQQADRSNLANTYPN